MTMPLLPHSLRTISIPWAIAGGWAIELFVGNRIREHGDIDLAVFRKDQLLLHQELPAWQFEKIINKEKSPWHFDQFLALPTHEIVATNPSTHERLEILLLESDATHWIYRRNSKITLALEKLIHRSKENIPYLAPEVVLLFKAKEVREKDMVDFKAAFPLLSEEQKTWLKNALLLAHPESKFLDVSSQLTLLP